MTGARAAWICAGLLAWGCGGVVGSGQAGAEPPPPPPRPVIGPLEYGPPAYPPGVGVPLLPPARSGVAASAGSLSPTPQQSSPPLGIAGVAITADTVTPAPLLPAGG